MNKEQIRLPFGLKSPLILKNMTKCDYCDTVTKTYAVSEAQLDGPSHIVEICTECIKEYC